MHQACAPPLTRGGDQQCPICKVETKLGAGIGNSPTDFPHWHEAEVGAPARRAKPRLSPEGKPPFPALRWPNQEEAEFYGYPTLKDWYVDHRQGDLKQDATRAQINGFETESRERANQAAHRNERDAGEEEVVQPVGESDEAKPAEKG